VLTWDNLYKVYCLDSKIRGLRPPLETRVVFSIWEAAEHSEQRPAWLLISQRPLTWPSVFSRRPLTPAGCCWIQVYFFTLTFTALECNQVLKLGAHSRSMYLRLFISWYSLILQLWGKPCTLYSAPFVQQLYTFQSSLLHPTSCLVKTTNLQMCWRCELLVHCRITCSLHVLRNILLLNLNKVFRISWEMHAHKADTCCFNLY